MYNFREILHLENTLVYNDSMRLKEFVCAKYSINKELSFLITFPSQTT